MFSGTAASPQLRKHLPNCKDWLTRRGEELDAVRAFAGEWHRECVDAGHFSFRAEEVDVTFDLDDMEDDIAAKNRRWNGTLFTRFLHGTRFCSGLGISFCVFFYLRGVG